MGIVVFVLEKSCQNRVSIQETGILHSRPTTIWWSLELVCLSLALLSLPPLFLPRDLSAATCPTSTVPSAGRTGPKTVLGGPRMAVWVGECKLDGGDIVRGA